MRISLESIDQALREADIEELISHHGCPLDEYDGEAKEIFDAIDDFDFDNSAINLEIIKEIISDVWQDRFEHEQFSEYYDKHFTDIARKLLDSAK